MELFGIDVDSVPLFAHGFIVLTTIVVIGLGAHWVVESAARIAKELRISELVIGLTVVALGTSAPEFAVTLIAAFKGQGDISIGNIVGSNIFNLGFILGGCALVRAIPTTPILLRRDGTVIGVTTVLLLGLIGWDLRLDHHDGMLLLILLGVYLGCLFKQRRTGVDDGHEGQSEDAGSRPSLSWDCVLLVVGLVCIVGGSHLLIESSTAIARGFGVSEWVIGVTIVAAGTSAPELATGLSGVIKGRYAISVGNVIGSDIFNLLGVLGLAGTLRPVEIDPAARVSLVALCGMVCLVLLFMRTGWRLSRSEGLALVAIAMLRWALDFSAHAPAS
jgi:cation:H+ antiporter